MHCGSYIPQLLRRYITFTATVTLDFSVPSKASYTVSAHATGVYQVNIVDLSGACSCDACARALQ
jgi:hypothetical protein